jgi:hypothetical protein
LNNSGNSSVIAISTQSGNGKKASLAITAPFKSNPKISLFQLLVVKHPLLRFVLFQKLINVLFFAKTIVFDLVFLQILKQKQIFNFFGSWFCIVTVFNPSLVSVTLFLS